MKLDTTMENQNEGLPLLRSMVSTMAVNGPDAEILDDVLPEPMITSEAMEFMQERLQETVFKKKKVGSQLSESKIL